ncbi:DUF3306 domain-containing protein [Methylobacterium nonmethylotrophicum]|uniref:DUF3306 domain-containing protein n=1 Tax=Methylobacterium nonmethylotrophicum TaxID=1141884 RepID=A0A4Z0NK60_9HYPH|nr:DUF3306 domain-containing protein [Methylobacterium nonmethylotrophicum]TGD96251.1 DUF3306 domain-containing protein [Methylobacterium nonmethylotrophicum]
MSDGFLTRWSRRKRDEARRPVAAPPDAPDAAVPTSAEAAPAEDEGSLSPEELAQLPSLATLTAATDLTPFLRAGVPRALRNAALRRMWSVDPAIRDFVSEAREYAYDWNTPGGVPGTGGAISAEDVRAMVERVFGSEEKEDAPDHTDQDEMSAGSRPLPSGRGVGGSKIPHGPEDPREGDALQCGALTVVPAAGRSALGPEPSPPSRDLRSPLPLSHTLERYRASPASPGEGIPRLSPDAREPEPLPPSPPHLRRHGGALPI